MGTDKLNSPNIPGSSALKQLRDDFMSPESKRIPARKDRWKRRGRRESARRVYGYAALGFFTGLGLLLLVWGLIPASVDQSLDGSFGQVVAQTFPEADKSRIELNFTELDGRQYPSGAILQMPAWLFGSSESSDPFARLADDFGGNTELLTGAELKERMIRVAERSLPEDVTRCYTYELGDLSGNSGNRIRQLHLHLNPGC